MAKEISKQTKTKKSGLLKAGTLTFVLAIIGTIIAAGMSIMPAAPALVGLVMFIVLVFIILLCSVCTAFIIWASDGFKNFINGFWSIIESCFNGAEQIWSTIKDIFPYLALATSVLVVAGFVVNLVGYLKNKDNKKQKGRMIATSILLGLSAILILVSGLVLFLTK